MLGANELIDRSRRNDNRSDTRGVVAENRDITTEVGSRDVEETVSFGSVGGATSINKASTTRFCQGVGTVGMKMGLGMGGRGHSTIIEVGTNAIKVMVMVVGGRGIGLL